MLWKLLERVWFLTWTVFICVIKESPLVQKAKYFLEYTTCKIYALFTTVSPVPSAIPATQVCSINIYGMNETINWHFRFRVVVSTWILLCNTVNYLTCSIVLFCWAAICRLIDQYIKILNLRFSLAFLDKEHGQQGKFHPNTW